MGHSHVVVTRRLTRSAADDVRELLDFAASAVLGGVVIRVLGCHLAVAHEWYPRRSTRAFSGSRSRLCS